MNGRVSLNTQWEVITIIYVNMYFKISKYDYINQVQNKTWISNV